MPEKTHHFSVPILLRNHEPNYYIHIYGSELAFLGIWYWKLKVRVRTYTHQKQHTDPKGGIGVRTPLPENHKNGVS